MIDCESYRNGSSGSGSSDSLIIYGSIIGAILFICLMIGLSYAAKTQRRATLVNSNPVASTKSSKSDTKTVVVNNTSPSYSSIPTSPKNEYAPPQG